MDKYDRNQNDMVRKEPENRTVNDLYGVQRRLDLVSRRLKESKEITQPNKELIFRITYNCSLRGLSKLRVLFYLNRFWNIARLAEKDFDKMGKEDIEGLVRKLQMKAFEPRTISDHLTAIKTFWKWLERCEDTYPEKVRWIKPWRSNKTRKLPATTCSICKHENPPEIRRCSNCGRPLDLKTALEDDKREHELLKMLTPEILEEMIQKRVQQLSNKFQPNTKSAPA